MNKQIANTWSGHASAPNRLYICAECGRKLGHKYDYIMGRKRPTVFRVGESIYCERCFLRKPQSEVLSDGKAQASTKAAG